MFQKNIYEKDETPQAFRLLYYIVLSLSHRLFAIFSSCMVVTSASESDPVDVGHDVLVKTPTRGSSYRFVLKNPSAQILCRPDGES